MKKRQSPTAKQRQPATAYYVPSQGTLSTTKRFTEMSPDEALLWVEGARSRLAAKKERERAYLDRRAARGTHTPTDEAYKQDQVLESEILAFLDDIITSMKAERGQP